MIIYHDSSDDVSWPWLCKPMPLGLARESYTVLHDYSSADVVVLCDSIRDDKQNLKKNNMSEIVYISEDECYICTLSIFVENTALQNTLWIVFL